MNRMNVSLKRSYVLCIVKKSIATNKSGMIFAGMKLHVGNKHTGEEYVKRRAACPHCSKVFILMVAFLCLSSWEHPLSVFLHSL